MPRFDKYLNKQIECSCGHTHHVPIERISLGQDILQTMEDFIRMHHFHSLLIVDDGNTKRVLGNLVFDWLVSSEGYRVSELCFSDNDHLIADEIAIDRAKTAIAKAQPDLMIAVGSGTITDITRYASFLYGCPFLAVPTAPSVDGYASTIAALQLQGVKVTKTAHAPLAIFADSTVLSEAPLELIQAGFGDLVGKVTSLLDWKLATMLYDEDWCDEAYTMVNESLYYCVQYAHQFLSRRVDVIEELFVGLLSSGVAMAMMTNSRPASGSEHHLSHYWDFCAYRGIRPYGSHGLQVGFAVHFTMKLYEHLAQIHKLHDPVKYVVDKQWEKEAVKRWGDVSPQIISEQRQKSKWLQERMIHVNLSQMTGEAVLKSLSVDHEFMQSAHKALCIMDIPNSPPYLAISSDLLQEATAFANEIRSRFTILDFYRDQGISYEGIFV